MTSNPEDISISAERRRIRKLPSGSRPRIIGSLWLAWLEHIRRCQTLGLAAASDTCVQHRGNSVLLENAYPNWDCCDDHKKLKDEREVLKTHIVQMDIHRPAPHQTSDTLTREWWLLLGIRYNVRRGVVD